MAYFSYMEDGLLHFGEDRTIPEGAVIYETEAAWQQAQLAAREPPPPITPEEPAPTPPSSCSKLGLKRAFAELGLWTTVRAMIASNAEMQEDWDLAIELRISDPIVRKAVAGLAELGIPLSDADVQALVTRANELVA